MSNTITHLFIANKILQNLPNLVLNKEAYYLGSVACDTIGSKDNFTRDDKKKSHLRLGIRDFEWLNNDKMAIFENRLKEFINENIYNENGNQKDFNLGYLVHLLTDKYNHKLIRQDMLKVASKLNILENDKKFFYLMQNELEALDYYLLINNEEINIILNNLLNQEVNYSLNGYIEKEYIMKSIEWWKSCYLPNIKERSFKYLTKKEIDIFLEISIKEITNEVNLLFNKD